MNMEIIPLLILLSFCAGVLANSQAEQVTMQLDPVVVTATRTAKPISQLPYSAEVITLDDNAGQTLNRSIPEAMKYVPGVMIQKTGHGQGSPYIRGFTGFRTLFLIDGIRLNNSVFRDGPNQYSNTVDPYSISNMEIIKGPSSVLYGSDAIGGTINLLSRGNDKTDPGFNLHPSFYYRFSDAESSHSGHFELSGNYADKFGFLVGVSYKDFGDLEGGESVGVQKKTGYTDFDINFKADYALTDDSKITIAHQHVDIDDAWRSHKTIYGISWHGTTVGNEKKRVLDQTRDLSYIKYEGENFDTFFDNLNLTFSYQQQEEERFRIKADDRSDRQGFELNTVGFNLEMQTMTNYGNWTYGLQYYVDHVDSFNKKYNADGSIRSVEIQGPVADDSSYDLFDVFIQNEVALTPSLEMIVGGRYTYAAVDANQIKDPVTGDKISYSNDWHNLSGSIRFLYHFDEAQHWNMFTGVSQGFRAPNLSDLTRLDTARTDEIETAALDLDPEQFISYEIGLKTDYDNWSVQLAYFYTDIEDMIIRTPTGRIVGGDKEVTKKNAGNGFIHGIEFGGFYRFHPQWKTFASVSWTEGHVDTFPTSTAKANEEPIDRMMPLTANLGLRWGSLAKDLWVEGLVTIAEGQNRLSTRDKGDTQRIPPGGTPGYTVYNLRGGWAINQYAEITLALDNLTDKDYRIHGSGVNEAGRNFILGFGLQF